MFSRTCEYAIRALVYIAQHTKDGRRVGIKEVAKGIDSSEYFIAKILQALSKKGFVRSAKGPHGGFYFLKKDLNISLADVVREIDGDDVFEGCALGLDQCGEEHPCPLHKEFKIIRLNLKRLLLETKIGNLAEELDERLVFLNNKERR